MRLILLLVLTFSFFIYPVFSQSELISVQVSDSSFQEGDTIVISGTVSTIIAGEPVIIQIFHNDNLIEIAQLNVAQDGSFSKTIIAQGPKWQQEGEYLVKATYGGKLSEANFEFFKEVGIMDTSSLFEVDAGSYGTFDVEYTIRGGTIKNMIVDPEIFGLIIVIESNADGSITVNLPRESIDAKKSDGTDDVYIILIDGIEVPNVDQPNSNSRTITIEFEEGDSDIEIIGTFVIPEFGTFAYLVLPASIMFIFLVTARKNLMKKIALKN